MYLKIECIEKHGQGTRQAWSAQDDKPEELELEDVREVHVDWYADAKAHGVVEDNKCNVGRTLQVVYRWSRPWG